MQRIIWNKLLDNQLLDNQLLDNQLLNNKILNNKILNNKIFRKKLFNNKILQKKLIFKSSLHAINFQYILSKKSYIYYNFWNLYLLKSNVKFINKNNYIINKNIIKQVQIDKKRRLKIKNKKYKIYKIIGINTKLKTLRYSKTCFALWRNKLRKKRKKKLRKFKYNNRRLHQKKKIYSKVLYYKKNFIKNVHIARNHTIKSLRNKIIKLTSNINTRKLYKLNKFKSIKITNNLQIIKIKSNIFLPEKHKFIKKKIKNKFFYLKKIKKINKHPKLNTNLIDNIILKHNKYNLLFLNTFILKKNIIYKFFNLNFKKEFKYYLNCLLNNFFFKNKLTFKINNINYNYFALKIRLKPGFSTLWRLMRLDYKSTYALSFKFQHQITKYVNKFSQIKVYYKLLYLYTTINYIFSKKFWTQKNILIIYINGTILYKTIFVNSKYIYTGDIIQLSFFYKFILIYNNITLFNNLIYTQLDLSSLSLIYLYNNILFSDWSALDRQVNYLFNIKMYNWKYIT